MKDQSTHQTTDSSLKDCEKNCQYPENDDSPSIISGFICAIPSQAEIIYSEAININQEHCKHYHLDIETDLAIGEGILCYICCFFGFIAALLGCILLILAKLNNNNSNSNSREYSSRGNFGLFPSLHCHYYDYYALHTILKFDSNIRIKYDQNKHNVNLMCLQMEQPHKYKVKCHNCNTVLKQGIKHGSICLSFLCGLIGMGLLTLGIFALIN